MKNRGKIMAQILLKNGYIVSMNEEEQVFDGGSVLILKMSHA